MVEDHTNNLMENGYYLTVYCYIDPMMNVYEKCYVRHDQNISLWRKDQEDITLVHHWELERRSGLKHHHTSFFSKEDFYEYVEELLKEYELTRQDIKQIIGLPFIDTDATYYQEDFGKELTYHAAVHSFTSLLIDSDIFYQENILSLSFDGGADVVIDKDADQRCNYMGAYSEKGEITYFPISSPGVYWFTAADIFGLEEGSLMALATASHSESLENLIPEELVEAYVFRDVFPVEACIYQIKDRIFSYESSDEGMKYNYMDENFTEEENKISMVMKIIQEISILISKKIVDEAIKAYHIDPSNTYLALSGGFALNCPTNSYLMQKYGFKDQLINPAVNDSGQAIGMGLYYFYKNCKHIKFHLKHAYYGDAVKIDLNYLKEIGLDQYIESIDASCNRFCDDVINSPIVWLNGRAEIGPRALGNRSIIADARTTRSKDLLNVYKKRQWWRPVAPMILEEDINEWFEDAFPSPYMLNNFVVKEGKREFVPAIMHIDYTARIQSINKEDNPLMYRLLKEFKEKTGVPVLCNTSLNDRGEAIINSLEQAINFALRKGIKIIYCNGNRIELKNHDSYHEVKPLRRADDIFIKYKLDDLECYNPYHLDWVEYYIYTSNSQLQKYDITKQEDVRRIKKLTKRMRSMYIKE